MTKERIDAWVECARSILPSRMKGKTIMWWITVNVLAMAWYCLITKRNLDGSIATIYGIAITAFVGSKGHELYEQRKSGRIQPPAAPTLTGGIDAGSQ